MMTRLLQALLVLGCWLIPHQLCAQQSDSILITGTYSQKSLITFLEEVETQHQVRFFYREAWLKGLIVNGVFAGDSLQAVLRQSLRNSDISVRQYDSRSFVFLTKDSYIATDSVTRKPIRLVRIGDSLSGGKGPFLLTGTVTIVDKQSPIVGVRVAVENLRTGAMTNAYGQFSLTLPAGRHLISFSYPEFETERREVIIYGSGKLDIEMFDAYYKLEEVTIESERKDQNVTSLDVGVNEVDLELATKLPSFLGEVDIVRSVLLLPGVTSVGEGATGYNVRGGTVDQNLILVDGAPVFNPSHVFGLFSNFNPDAISDVTLYKGGVPARFGGRSASVMDIALREGSFDKWEVQGGLGLISSRLAAGGPLIKDQTSILLSGRLSYGGWLIGLLPGEVFEGAQARFYDLSGKFTHKFEKGHKLSISGYRSQDAFKLAQDTLFRPTNTAASIQYQHVFGKKLLGKIGASFGDYSYQAEGLAPQQRYALEFGIRQYDLKASLTYSSGGNTLQVGVQANRYSVRPGELNPLDAMSSLNPVALPQEQGIEIAPFIQDEFEIGKRLRVQLGMRLPFYFYLGPGEQRTYAEDQPRRENNALGTVAFEAGSLIQAYQGIEPRLLMRYLLSERSSVKISAQRMRQYLHLISNTTAITPIDIWKLSDTYLRPQLSDQYSIGYFRNYLNNAYESSIEVYYKQITDLVEYKDGAELVLNPRLETALINGNGVAYGVELLLQKKTGPVTGWASYTYSRTLRQVSGGFPEEIINNGEWYPSNFDKPHDFTIAMNYQFTRRYGVSANFTYSTGRPFTGPEAKYVIDGIVVASYGPRNQFRIPDYHRLDVSLTFGKSLKKDKKYTSEWAFSIYNIYGRRNPYSVFFRDTRFGPPQALMLSVLGAPFPALIYNFKF